MDGGAWWAAVHGVTEGRTRLSDFTFTFHFHALEKEMATHSSVLVWRIPETGASWAAIYGVAQSQTRLKQLSSSSSSSLLSFTDLIFQVPMPYCSLQHQTLLPSPVTSTTECCFHFGSMCSFFLELLLHCSPVAHWSPTNLQSSSCSVISFCLFILFIVFSRQES